MLNVYIIIVVCICWWPWLTAIAKIKNNSIKFSMIALWAVLIWLLPYWAFKEVSICERKKLNEVAIENGYKLYSYWKSYENGDKVKRSDFSYPYSRILTGYRVIRTEDDKLLLVKYKNYLYGELYGFELIRFL